MTGVLYNETDDNLIYLSHHAPEYYQDEISAEINRRINERLNQSGSTSPIGRTTTSRPAPNVFPSQKLPERMAKNMPRNRFYWSKWAIPFWVGVGLFFMFLAFLAIWTTVLIWMAK